MSLGGGGGDVGTTQDIVNMEVQWVWVATVKHHGCQPRVDGRRRRCPRKKSWWWRRTFDIKYQPKNLILDRLSEESKGKSQCNQHREDHSDMIQHHYRSMVLAGEEVVQ